MLFLGAGSMGTDLVNGRFVNDCHRKVYSLAFKRHKLPVY